MVYQSFYYQYLCISIMVSMKEIVYQSIQSKLQHWCLLMVQPTELLINLPSLFVFIKLYYMRGSTLMSFEHELNTVLTQACSRLWDFVNLINTSYLKTQKCLVSSILLSPHHKSVIYDDLASVPIAEQNGTQEAGSQMEGKGARGQERQRESRKKYNKWKEERMKGAIDEYREMMKASSKPELRFLAKAQNIPESTIQR